MPTEGMPEPREDATVMDRISDDVAALKDKVVELNRQLAEVEGQKKSANKGFNDAIKDIKEEIKMTLALIKGQEEDNA